MRPTRAFWLVILLVLVGVLALTTGSRMADSIWESVFGNSADEAVVAITTPTPIPVSALTSPPAPPVCTPKTHTVKGGDTLERIAKQYYGDSNEYIRLFDANRGIVKYPDSIQIGWKLVVPCKGLLGVSKKAAVAKAPKPASKKKTPKPEPMSTAEAIERSAVSVMVEPSTVVDASVDAVDWRHIGVDTVVPKNWHLGGAGGMLEMTPKQGQRLSQLGLTEEEVSVVAQNLRSGKCSITSRGKGHIWEGGMGFGSGYWSAPTRNSTGDAVDAWACPSVNGKQVDFPKCGNPAVNIVTPPPPPVVVEAPTDERTPLCMLQGMEFAQGGIGTNYDGHNAVVAMELACLRKVGDRWEMGPMIHFGRGWFHEEDAKGRSNGLHAGGRFRYTAQDGSVFKFDIALGPGSLLASGHKGEWKIEKFGGLDLWLAPQWEKCWAEGTCLEVMGYATIPLTGRLGDVKGDGWVNEDGATRVWTAGVLARLSHDFGWFFIPEVTTGLMAQEDVDTLGIPLKFGPRTRDRAFRAWVGLELWEGDTFVFGLEHNWGGKALYLDSKGRLEELGNGAQVSIDTPVDLNQGNPKAKVAATSRKAKSHTKSSWTPKTKSAVTQTKGSFADVSFSDVRAESISNPPNRKASTAAANQKLRDHGFTDSPFL